MEDDFKVSVESQVRYLNRRITELGAVITGDVVDFELAKKMGHQIKGNAENFEFENLIDMAKKLEFSATQADRVAVQSAVQLLLGALNVHLKNLTP